MYHSFSLKSLTIINVNRDRERDLARNLLIRLRVIRLYVKRVELNLFEH